MNASPEKGSGGGDGEASILVVVAVIALVGVVIAGLFSCVTGMLRSSSKNSSKTMKAPGRDSTILRRTFEKDTASYFRGLRNK